MRLRQQNRRGALAVEGAFVYSAYFLMLFMFVIGGIGIFQYQLIATLASEGARYACVHGSFYADETQNDSPTAQNIFDRAVSPLAISMDRSKLSSRVEWINSTTGQTFDWDASPKRPYNRSATGVIETNRVRVTVSYRWFPERFLVGPFTMTAAVEVPMAF
jgi:Flp pilus assembly protein TadG